MKKIITLKKILIYSFFVLLSHFIGSFALSDFARSKGFVCLDEIDPTIQRSLRYFTEENFLGTRVDGYKTDRVVLLKEVALALKEVQKDFKKDGYCLVVYDAYRPQKAVDHFVRWTQDTQDQKKKSQYYPRADKDKFFELGYIAKRSGHSLGSRVDLTIIKKGKKPHAIVEKKRKLIDGFEIIYLDDGTIDMGSSFDLYDQASHISGNLITKKQKASRDYLQDVMQRHGFIAYPNEWWHFNIVNEPYSANLDSSYFDFDIE